MMKTSKTPQKASVQANNEKMSKEEISKTIEELLSGTTSASELLQKSMYKGPMHLAQVKSILHAVETYNVNRTAMDAPQSAALLRTEYKTEEKPDA